MISSSTARLGVRLVALACATISLPACATMTRGSSEQYRIESTPPGATVTTSNGFRCVATPCTFRMPRKDSFNATVSLEGYATQTHQVESKMSSGGAAGMAGNLLVGGIIGGVVDATSGAMNDLTPNPLIVTLRTPSEQTAADAAAQAAVTSATAQGANP